MPQQSTAAQIEPTPPAWRQRVLELLRLGHARSQRLTEAAACGEVNMSGLFHARRGDTFVGAAWGQIIPGHAAFCWPARIVIGESEETAENLQQAVDQHLDQAGVVITQAILGPQDVINAVRLTRAHYTHLSDLDYLVSSSEQFPANPPKTELTFRGMDRNGIQDIGRLIDQTYHGTLDCTDIDGVRSTNDVLTGYRRTGVFRPQWWTVAALDGKDVGCVLLADHPEHDQCELMYMGVIPEARGHNWGYQLTRYAQWLAHAASRQRIVLAVDETNWPARNLYAQAGFELWDRRSVYVRTARPQGPGSPSAEKKRGK